MKNCEICGVSHKKKHKITKKPLKYCSEKCALKKCHQNRYNNLLSREKHNKQERDRYWKKHGIRSESDYKIAPKGSGCITKWGYKRLTKHGHPNAGKCGA